MRKYLKWAGYALLAFTILGIIAVATDTSNAEENSADAQSPASGDKAPDLSYEVTKKEKSANQLDFRLTIHERLDRASLIEIVRKLKKENDWQEKLVCFFDVNVYSASNAWASVAYLPRCPECETEKDKDGNAVQYTLIGVSKSFADSLHQLTFDSIANKRAVATYIEDIYRCKSQLFVVNEDESKLLLVQQFIGGGHLLQWLKLKNTGGEKRYYFDDEEPGHENYVVLNEQKKIADFKDHMDKVWMSYGYE